MAGPVRRARVVAVLGGSGVTGELRATTRGSTAVRKRIFEAIRDEAPLIAKPDLERAVAAGIITARQRDEFLARLERAESAGAPATELTHDQRRVAATVFDAIRTKAPVIAEPLLAEAVADGSIDRDEAERIKRRLSTRRLRIGKRRSRRSWRPSTVGPATA
jgi:hypothetical protein